jgi:hypothetical protein
MLLGCRLAGQLGAYDAVVEVADRPVCFIIEWDFLSLAMVSLAQLLAIICCCFELLVDHSSHNIGSFESEFDRCHSTIHEGCEKVRRRVGEMRGDASKLDSRSVTHH